MKNKESNNNLELAGEPLCPVDQKVVDTNAPQQHLQRVLPCMDDAELRFALDKLLHPISIEVAGGIVRHHRSW